MQKRKNGEFFFLLLTRNLKYIIIVEQLKSDSVMRV